MDKKIYAWLLLGCGAVVLLACVIFFQHKKPIAVDIPIFTAKEVGEYKAQLEQEAQRRQIMMEQARKRSEKENRMLRCSSDDECVIVDSNPCGCLKGPSGVTTINGAFSLEFTALMEKKFGIATACPSTPASTEKECSPTAEAVCRENLCKIIY